MEKRKILIVDDQKEMVKHIANELNSQSNQYHILNASNGENAIKIAAETIPDLIIMDWDMPVMNGLEATRKLKNDQVLSDIPVIMATGQMTNPEDLRLALEAGAVDYVRKPVEFIELSARINTALRIRSQHESIKQLLKSDIDLKNRKLSTTSMLIVEKNGILQNFQSEIEQLQSLLKNRKLEDLAISLRELSKRISSHLDVDNSWDTFKMHFEEVHPDFFEEILEIAPDLSTKDLKICAYLKLNMDTKQIARLLNVEPASARTIFYRLKKKMQLSEEESIREFILQLKK